MFSFHCGVLQIFLSKKKYMNMMIEDSFLALNDNDMSGLQENTECEVTQT